jgi:hypothetical protein
LTNEEESVKYVGVLTGPQVAAPTIAMRLLAGPVGVAGGGGTRSMYGPSVRKLPGDVLVIITRRNSL